MTEQIRVFVDGTFDLIHPNHITFLENARALGDHLIVGLMNDTEVQTYKRRPILNEDERLRMVLALRVVDEAFIVRKPLVRQTMEEIIASYRVSKVVYSGGDDYTNYYGPAIERGMMVTPPYLSGISSSQIIQRIRNSDFP